jgi:hypothetical protein
MEWLDRGQYTYEHKHPPLARIAVAIGPYLDGVRSVGLPNLWSEGRALLYQNDRYQRTLTLARLGVLPFLVVGAVFLWLWARLLGGPAVGLVALGVFTTLPPVLGHAGLATTDVPMLGAMAALLFAATHWLDRPTAGWSAALGVAGAATLLTKFSSVPYSGLALAIVLVVRWFFARTRTDGAGRWRALVPGLGRPVLITLGVAALVVWAVYRFQVGTIRGIPVPASELIDGLLQVKAHNEMGQVTYLLGHAGFMGTWQFFPVVLLVKTPLATLLLGLAGIVWLGIAAQRRRDWRLAFPVAVAIAVLAVAMASRINLGVRHVLPLYLALSVGAGFALVGVWRATSRRRVLRVLAMLAVTAASVSSIRAHPDYLAYFNEIAGDRPEGWLVDSDLDWGQDVLRLADTVRARGIPSVAINYYGTTDITRHGMPDVTRWDWREHPTGWVAISLTKRMRGHAILRNRTWTLIPDAYAWLDAYQPVARIGRSMLLYHLTGPASHD